MVALANFGFAPGNIRRRQLYRNIVANLMAAPTKPYVSGIKMDEPASFMFNFFVGNIYLGPTKRPWVITVADFHHFCGLEISLFQTAEF